MKYFCLFMALVSVLFSLVTSETVSVILTVGAACYFLAFVIFCFHDPFTNET